jgi:predicted O-methyltransferase YrrM
MRSLPWHRVPAPIRYQVLSRTEEVRATLFGPTMVDRDAAALQMLAPLVGEYVPWTSYSLRPEAIATFLNAIVLLDAEQIVECGAGLSTIYAARLLAQRDRGHLDSIEQDKAWAEAVQQTLQREGTAGRVNIHVAGIDADGWYSRAALASLRPEPVQVLLVDGPLKEGRHTAVDYFADRLASDYAVILDDVWWPTVEVALRRWESRLGTRGKRQYRQGGVGVVRPPGATREITY